MIKITKQSQDFIIFKIPNKEQIQRGCLCSDLINKLSINSPISSQYIRH